MKARLLAYRERLQEKKVLQYLRSSGSHELLKASCGKHLPVRIPKHEDHIYDLNQTAGGASRSSKLMPCLLTSSEMYSDRHQRCLLKEELLSVMGIPTLPVHGVAPEAMAMTELLCPVNPSHLQLADCKKLAGNGMHMNVIGNLMLWLLANLISVSD